MGINETMFMRGFNIFIVVKHQRLQIRPAIAAIMIIVSIRESSESFFCNCEDCEVRRKGERHKSQVLLDLDGI